MTTATATAPETATTTDQPTDQPQTVGTVKPADLIAALDAVLPHAERKGGGFTFLQGVKIEAADGALIFIASDRYTLGTYTVPWNGPDVDALVSSTDAVELQKFAKGAAKHVRELPVLALEFGGGKVRASFGPDDAIARPLQDGDRFPKWRAVMPDYNSEEDRGVNFIGINPAHLVKFSKAGERNEPLRFTFGRSPLRPVLVTCGEHFRGLIMPVKMPD